MSSGPWHFKEAERLLADDPEVVSSPDPDPTQLANRLTLALVHATLAAAAAAAPVASDEWAEATL